MTFYFRPSRCNGKSVQIAETIKKLTERGDRVVLMSRGGMVELDEFKNYEPANHDDLPDTLRYFLDNYSKFYK